jgi:hypothetical protein
MNANHQCRTIPIAIYNIPKEFFLPEYSSKIDAYRLMTLEGGFLENSMMCLQA